MKSRRDRIWRLLLEDDRREKLWSNNSASSVYDGCVFREWMAWAIPFVSLGISRGRSARDSPAPLPRVWTDRSFISWPWPFNNTPTTTGKTSNSKRNDQCKNSWPPQPKWAELSDKKERNGYTVSEWTRFNFVSTCFVFFPLLTCPFVHFACWTAWTQLAYVMDDDKCDEILKNAQELVDVLCLFFVCLSGEEMGAKKCQSNFFTSSETRRNKWEQERDKLDSWSPVISPQYLTREEEFNGEFNSFFSLIF